MTVAIVFHFTGAESHGRFAQSVGYGAEKFLGAAQRNRNHHQAERESSGERREMLEGQDHQAVRKNADDDRGNSVEQVRGVTHNEGGRTAANTPPDKWRRRNPIGTQRAKQHEVTSRCRLWH